MEDIYIVEGGGNVVAQGANKNLSPTKKTCKRLDFTTCPRYTFTFKTLENCGQRDDYSRIEFSERMT